MTNTCKIEIELANENIGDLAGLIKAMRSDGQIVFGETGSKTATCTYTGDMAGFTAIEAELEADDNVVSYVVTNTTPA